MYDDPTNEDRAEWAATALAAFNDAAPADVLSLSGDERARLGIVAAEALARVTRFRPTEWVVDDTASADEVIGDLFAYVFHLSADRITPDQLIRSAEELRNPGNRTAETVLTLAANELDRVAAMLAALIEAAASFGCEVPQMLGFAREFYELTVAEEAEDRAGI